MDHILDPHSADWKQHCLWRETPGWDNFLKLVNIHPMPHSEGTVTWLGFASARVPSFNSIKLRIYTLFTVKPPDLITNFLKSEQSRLCPSSPSEPRPSSPLSCPVRSFMKMTVPGPSSTVNLLCRGRALPSLEPSSHDRQGLSPSRVSRAWWRGQPHRGQLAQRKQCKSEVTVWPHDMRTPRVEGCQPRAQTAGSEHPALQVQRGPQGSRHLVPAQEHLGCLLMYRNVRETVVFETTIFVAICYGSDGKPICRGVKINSFGEK